MKMMRDWRMIGKDHTPPSLPASSVSSLPLTLVAPAWSQLHRCFEHLSTAVQCFLTIDFSQEQTHLVALSCCTRHSKVLAAFSISQSFLTVITHGKGSQFSRTGEVCTMDNRPLVLVIPTQFKNEQDPTGPSN